jgi:cyclic pyranopterin phosphate synthase
MHCPYCHREGEHNVSTVMSVEEIVRITQIAMGFGVSRVKLTGGEPLLRKDVFDICSSISRIRGLTDLSMTTNGTFLERMAEDLKTNGLNRVNVSLPTLNSEEYQRIMGGDLHQAIKGIKAAVKAELDPVKINMLLLKDINHEEVERMIEFTEKTKTILQIIELEPINVSNPYFRRHHLDLNDIEERLEKRALKVKIRRDMQNRKVYSLPKGKVELIRPTENTAFCAHCTRIRVTSDGKLKPCLMRNDNLVDIISPLRKGATDEKLASLFLKAIERREPYYKTADS